MPGLQIHLLGSFHLAVNGESVSGANWQKRKAKLLVQILALQPARELHREELIEILFPEIEEKRANANFYRVLYAARHALEPDRISYSSSSFLVTDGEQIRLTANGLWIDAEEFEQKAREGLNNGSQELLESAATLYAGDLLADEPFEDWISERRERLKMLFHKVLHHLAENAEMQADFEKAHFRLDRILQIEPADETAHQAKMRLYIEQGDRTLALRQYEQCAKALSNEFSVKPDAETEKLKNQIFCPNP